MSIENAVQNHLGLVGQVPVNQMAEREREIAERKSRLIRERMSPKGALGLPRLLDEALVSA